MPSIGADPIKVDAFGACKALDNDVGVAAANLVGNGRRHCWSSSMAS